MRFATIKRKDTQAPEIYHGIILWKSEECFEFGFRVDTRNYIWKYWYDAWDLIE